MTTKLFLGEGTWGGEWARDLSPGGFREFLRLLEFDCSIVVWTTNADGTPNPFSARGNRDWSAGGYAERYKLGDFPYTKRNKLTHSHGIGPSLYQLTLEDPDEPIVPVQNLLAISPPPRGEFIDMAQEALERGTLGALRVIYADGWDLMARLGQAFDGHLGWRRDWSAVKHPNFSQRGEKHVGHSGIFDRKERHRLVDGGDVDFLKTLRAPRAEVLGV